MTPLGAKRSRKKKKSSSTSTSCNTIIDTRKTRAAEPLINTRRSKWDEIECQQFDVLSLAMTATSNVVASMKINMMNVN